MPLELTAAKGMFESRSIEKIDFDGHSFYGGKMGEHYVVMGVQHKMGTDAASDLAARMRSAFKNIEFFLVVGIGGGVPSYGPPGAKSEIVLGDVVVSVPFGDYGGVVRYDSGAWVKGGQLEKRGHINGPSSRLLETANLLKADHQAYRRASLPPYLREMRTRIDRDERDKFEDPGAHMDNLFIEYDHPQRFRDRPCEGHCDLSRSKNRDSRGIEAVRPADTPKIHYGNIASSNQVQRSEDMRNDLQNRLQVICFEMEGAGVVQGHDCLVVRGICDYSDSHKNKIWQAYAAATAAAYARDYLRMMPKSDHAGK